MNSKDFSVIFLTGDVVWPFCENYDTSNPTILTIEGVYKHGENQALEVSQQVVFRDIVRDGSGNITSQDVIPLQRNHLYKVVLTPKYNLGALEYEKMDYAIQVVDWQNGETVKFTGDANLTHQSMPNFTVTNVISVSGTEADGVTNPTSIYTSVNEHSVYLIVTSETTGTMLESTTFPSTQYGLVSSATTNDANGNLVETYKIDIDDNIAVATDYTFTLSNAINTSLARTFVLKKRPKLPIEYIAPTNVTASSSDIVSNKYSPTTYRMAASNDIANSAYILNESAQTLVHKLFVEQDGVSTAYYHLPGRKEMGAIIPYDFNNTSTSSYSYKNGIQSKVEETLKWGAKWNSSTNAYDYLHVGTYYSDYNFPSSEDKVAYALRLIEKDGSDYRNGDYTCAYMYKHNESGNDPETKKNAFRIKVKYIGPNQSISINDLNSSFFDDAEFSITFPVWGYFNPTHSPGQGIDLPAGGYTQVQSATTYYSYYWSYPDGAPSANGTSAYYFSNTDIKWNPNSPLDRNQVRLFKDEE